MNFLLYYSLALYLSLPGSAADPAPAKPSPSPLRQPCTIRSPTSGTFFDLSQLNLPDPALSKSKHPRDHSWNTTGHDYPYNFTMNICGPVIEDVVDVVGVEKAAWKNVSAYYTFKGKNYSIGQQNAFPVLRGRKLVLNYTDGSPCDEPSSRRDLEDVQRSLLGARKTDEDEDDDDEKHRKDDKEKSKAPVRRKNTIISFLCDRDPTSPTLTLNFVDASPDSCSYFFEARTEHACGGPGPPTAQSIGPGAVFGIIALIAVAVYIVGGCVYSRMVLQQRGWRQCPNYNLWAGILSFFTDAFVILSSSCARCLPSRRGYSRVNGNLGGMGSGRGRGRDSDAENRLIDELNEEWDD